MTRELWTLFGRELTNQCHGSTGDKLMFRHASDKVLVSYSLTIVMLESLGVEILI